ncbi:MAG TPA: X2-like carbohydrate binding domain-containing protein, partial [Clostridia bacterium]|nr:X2-like carbohydrate binding domain-containing protein [Clostridia bacterium]
MPLNVFPFGVRITDRSVVAAPCTNDAVERLIEGLTRGTQYTVSGNTVTILKSYLNTLTEG